VLAAVLLRRHQRTSAALREAAVVVGLYAGWCLVGLVTHPHVAGARERGRQVFRLEHDLHLPSELTVQHWVLPHPTLGHLVDGYYIYGHVNVMIAVLAWTWFRHRDGYAALRLQLIGLTVLAMALEFVAVAPPRLLPDLGFVDLANHYGESVYGNYGGGLDSQLLAMPSLHVGWAALAAWTIWQHARGPWRWLGVAHLVVMTLVVVASANHWWLDGIVAVALLAVVVVAVDRIPALGAARGQSVADAALVPASA
jgi:hypothetical protein